MVHLFRQKECSQVKNVVPSPTECPTPVEVQSNHCSHFESQVMRRNQARRNIPDAISSTSQNVTSKTIKNSSFPSISSPSQG